MSATEKYQWVKPGDLNAFFALFLDNIVNMVYLTGILVGVFGFPLDVITKYMIPGTALGVMVGDLIYSYLAFRLAKKTGRQDVTAMPLGLDTPSTIGIALAVLGPAFLILKSQGLDEQAAAINTWYVGMGVMLWMSLVKFVASFFGAAIQKMLPSASLLGSLAGVGLALLAANSLIDVYKLPFVGVLAMGVILFTLVAHRRLAFNLPGAAAAVLFGCIVYYVMLLLNSQAGWFGSVGHLLKTPDLNQAGFFPPLPTLAGFGALFGMSLNFLPVAIPFGLLTVIGGINVTEGARLVGDEYKTRDILLTEALATFVAGVCGGVAQSTPYIGHSAYKKMGARAAYTLATGIAVGIGGAFGLVQIIIALIPKAAVAPILVFVGFEIMALAFSVVPKRHAMAVVAAIVPSVWFFGFIKLNPTFQSVQFGSARILDGLQEMQAAGVEQAGALADQLQFLIPPTVAEEFPILLALSQGFILTAMIWGAVAAFLIDRKIWSASIALGVAAVFSFFGLIHSVFPNGDLYLPWMLAEIAAAKQVVLAERALTIPYEFSLAYLVLAVFIPVMYYLGPARSDSNAPEEE